jgi:Cys-tRNA(Pro)/Cys-tRNA(Cys) deacylase
MKERSIIRTPVTIELDSKGIPYHLFIHKNPIRSLEQAAEERGQIPKQIVRSILFRLPNEQYIMVLAAGNEQISWTILRKFLNTSRITMANKKQVLEQTGYEIGTVSPLGLIKHIRLLVDKSVFHQDIISIGSGKRGIAVILTSEHLKNALDKFEEGCFVECM